MLVQKLIPAPEPPQSGLTGARHPHTDAGACQSCRADPANPLRWVLCCRRPGEGSAPFGDKCLR